MGGQALCAVERGTKQPWSVGGMTFEAGEVYHPLADDCAVIWREGENMLLKAIQELASF